MKVAEPDEPVFDWTERHAEPAQMETMEPSSPRWRWAVWLSFAIATALILSAGLVGWWYLGKVYPKSSPTTVVELTIDDGTTLDTLANRLYREELIADPGLFKWYVQRNGGLEVTPGYYQIRGGEHMGDVLDRLRTPPDQVTRDVTFPEGFTIAQMAERLAKDDPLLKADVFNFVARDGTVSSRFSPPGQTSLEGLLFPDTYSVSNADNEGQVAERMATRMERVATQEDLEEGAERLRLTPYQVLTVASIIEREAKVPEDRPKIARVIYNRLELDMALEIDATLYYGTPGFNGSFAELRQVESPYNSYRYKGLPPTPISNPGRASIRAALNPADNPDDRDPLCRGLPDPTNCRYLYYVLASPDGQHVFATTAEQHEVNVAAARDKGLL